MKSILSFFLSLFIFVNLGCEQFLDDDENAVKLTGIIKDSNGNLLQDVKIYFIFNFDQISGVNKNPGSNNTFADSSSFDQNYPNPFNDISSFPYSIRKPSIIKFDIYNFKGELVIPSAWTDTLDLGSYFRIEDFSHTLPSSGYKIRMYVDEHGDSAYSFEKDFIKSYDSFKPSIIETVPNLTAGNGTFEINYQDLPLGLEYIKTSESDPTPGGIFKVNNILKIIAYKQGYQIVQKDVVLTGEQIPSILFILGQNP